MCGPVCPVFSDPPDRLGPEHIRQYQLYLVQEKHASWSRVIQTVCALRFFYRITLGKPWMIEYIPQPKRPKTLPTVLRPAEVTALLQAPRRLKTRAVLTTLYAAGLRVTDYDFVHDETIDGRRLKCLTVLDEYTREGSTLYCARSITAEDVVQVLQRLFVHRGAPRYVQSDNGPESIAQRVTT